MLILHRGDWPVRPVQCIKRDDTWNLQRQSRPHCPTTAVGIKAFLQESVGNGLGNLSAYDTGPHGDDLGVVGKGRAFAE